MSERSDLLSRRNRKTVKELRETEASAVVVEKIHDIETYDPSKTDTSVLRDDFRIALAWYASWKDPDRKIQFTREQIKDVLKRIVAELAKRGTTQFHPDTMAPPAREIFEEVARELKLQPEADIQKNGEPVSAPNSVPHPTPESTNKLTPEILAGLSDDELKEVANELAELWGSMFGSAVVASRIGETIDLPTNQVAALKTREKRLVLSAEPIVAHEPVVLTSDGMAHGLLSLGPPQELSDEQFSSASIKRLHLVSDEERAARWPEQKLFCHEVKGSVWFAEPVKVDSAAFSIIRKLSQEDIVNAAIFLLREASKRQLDLGFPPDLMEAVAKIDSTAVEKQLTNNAELDGALSVLPEIVLVNDYVNVVGGSVQDVGVKGLSPSDVDVLVRSSTVDEAHTLKLSRALRETTLGKDLHFIFHESGPNSSYLPIYDLVLRPRQKLAVVPVHDGLQGPAEPDAVEKAGVQLFHPFQPLKSLTGYHVGEFFDFQSLWDLWAKDHIANGISVEEKFDGMRFVAHKDGDRVALYTEDSKRDRAAILKDVAESVRKLPVKSAIIDGEMVWWKDGEPIPRQDMMAMVMSKTPIVGEDIRFDAFDVLLYDGEDLSNLPWDKRQEFLRKAVPGEHIGQVYRVTPTGVAESEPQLKAAFEKAAKGKGSEGAMFKDAKAPYDLKGRTGTWAKLKLVAEIKVEVIGRAKPMPPHYTGTPSFSAIPGKSYYYRVAFLDGSKLIPFESEKKLSEQDVQVRHVGTGWKGLEDPALWEMGKGFPQRKAGEYAYANTYVTAVEAKPGDILTVSPSYIRDWIGSDGERHYSWQHPSVREKDESTGTRQADDIEQIRRMIQATAGRTSGGGGMTAPTEKDTITSTDIAQSGKKNPAHATYESQLIQKQGPGEFGGEHHKPGTHEAARVEEERVQGDQYMVRQQGTTKYPFVVQHHFRGIWSQAERQQLNKGLRDAIDFAKTNESEARKMIAGLWKTFRIETLKAPLDTVARAAQHAADSKGDVAAAAKNYLDDSPPAPVDLQRILPNIVNRGNVHTDFRMRSPEGDWLIGWTMDTPGIVLQTLDGKLLKLLRSKLVENEPKDNILAQRKAKQPVAWLTIVRPGSAVFRAEPGEVGGTTQTAGEFRFVDRGEVIYGVQKTDYHELFLFFEKNKQLSGRWGSQLLQGQANYEKAPEEKFWLINRPSDTQAPYITTHDFEKEQEKAKREGVKMLWNPDTINALKAVGYKALPADAEEATVKALVPIFKTAEERTVFGVVLEPETIDAHGDVIGAEEIRNAAYKYMEFYQLKGFQHGKSARWPAFPDGVRLLESYIAPVDFEVNGRRIKQGTWLIRMRVDHDGLWEDVKGGRVTGFSIGGFARGLLEQRAA